MTKEEKSEKLKIAHQAASEANKGNSNSSKNNRLLNQTLHRVLTQEDGLKARQIVEVLVSKALDGDMAAIKEIYDRHEGKAVSKTELSGPDGSAIPLNIGLNFVKANSIVS